MTVDLKYSYIFDDHMKMARERCIEKTGEEPTKEEIFSEYNRMMEYFYD